MQKSSVAGFYRNAGMMCLAKVSIWRISSSSDMKPWSKNQPNHSSSPSLPILCSVSISGAQRLDRTPVAVRPVQARPGQQFDLATVDPGVHAVAIVLDLVQPAGARRRLIYQARELRLDPLRRPRCRSHVHRVNHIRST